MNSVNQPWAISDKYREKYGNTWAEIDFEFKDILEKNFLEIQMKGMDHYVFIKENGKAQVVYEEGRWVAEHIRTAILKFNYEIDKIDKLFIRDFTDAELKEYEKISSRD